jgi:DNA-binding SARP family transcriptional activator
VPLEFRILGSLEVVEDNRELQLAGAKQRELLAILLVHANEPVSVDVLSDELWGGEPPQTAGKMIQGYVSQLRKVLGDGVLVTRAPGYLAREATIEPFSPGSSTIVTRSDSPMSTT